MTIEPQYCTLTCDKRIVFKEKGRKICFVNEQRQPCYKVQVDGGVIQDRGVKCDNLLIVSQQPSPSVDLRSQEHFVELKGTDVLHALEQVKRTVSLLATDKKVSKRHAYIVCKNVAPKTKTKRQIVGMWLRENYDCELSIGESFEPRI